MNFEHVRTIFYQHIPRRYHRHCRELYAQLLCCLDFSLKPAYLFDLFPFSIKQMRSLIDNLYLRFPAILLKYSLNDLIIVNSQQLEKLQTPSTSILIIDLLTMTISDDHPMLSQIRHHLTWIVQQQPETIDFDDETNAVWCELIRPLNHTTVFGYLLGYPLVFFYSQTAHVSLTSLCNFRLYINFDENDILLYSFSSPIHSNIDLKQIEFFVNEWFSTLSLLINSIDMIKHCHLEKQIKHEFSYGF